MIKEKQHTNDSIAYNELAEENKKLKRQLKLAIERIEDMRDYTEPPQYIQEFLPINMLAKLTLKNIKELETQDYISGQ